MNKLRQFRLSLNENQEGFAKLCEIPLTTLQKLETGVNKINNAKLSTLTKIARVLNVPVNELMDEQNVYAPIPERDLSGIQQKNLEILTGFLKRSSSSSTFIDKFHASMLDEFKSTVKDTLNLEFVYTQAKEYLITYYLKNLFEYRFENFPQYILIEVSTYSQGYISDTTSLLIPLQIETHVESWEKASMALIGFLSLFQETVVFTEVNESRYAQESIKNTYKIGEIIQKLINSTEIPDEYKTEDVCGKLRQFLSSGLTTTDELYSIHRDLEYLCFKSYTVYDNSYNNNAGNGTIVRIKSLIGLKVL